MARTAMTLITGGLGSVKTTLVQRFIDDVPLKLAVLVLEVEEQINDVRLDCVIYIADAYTSLKYPRMGYVERTQLQAADAVLINKADLVTGDQLETVEARIRRFNTRAALVRTIYARVDVNLLLGTETGKRPRVPAHRPHTVDLVQFSYRSHSDSAISSVARCFAMSMYSDGTTKRRMVKISAPNMARGTDPNRITNGSRKELNCTASTRKIIRIASPSAGRNLPPSVRSCRDSPV